MSKQLRITVEGKTYDVTVETVGETATVTQIATAPKAAPVVASVAAAPVPAAPAPARAAAAPVAAGAGNVVAPLAAVVISVGVKVGQAVATGDHVATIEAMKMNTIVTSTVSGTVTAIHVTPGQSVEEGQPLLTIG